jgi:hypothetical protein
MLETNATGEEKEYFDGAQGEWEEHFDGFEE